MAPRRQPTGESEATRRAILDATETIMCEEGYAAVSSRHVAERAGLKSQLVYYHFGTMDELFLALYRRNLERFSAAHAAAISSDRPLSALFHLGMERAGAAMTQEFLALANHRKVIRKEIIGTTLHFRRLQAAVVSRALAAAGGETDPDWAEALPFFIISLSSALAAEEGFEITLGHAGARRLVEARLKALDEAGRERGAPCDLRGRCAAEPADLQTFPFMRPTK